MAQIKMQDVFLKGTYPPEVEEALQGLVIEILEERGPVDSYKTLSEHFFKALATKGEIGQRAIDFIQDKYPKAKTFIFPQSFAELVEE